jgi:hypothetical protein
MSSQVFFFIFFWDTGIRGQRGEHSGLVGIRDARNVESVPELAANLGN